MGAVSKKGELWWGMKCRNKDCGKFLRLRLVEGPPLTHRPDTIDDGFLKRCSICHHQHRYGVADVKQESVP